jgi:phosphoglycolate phosphatase-like HAD superfamily hydrolase
VARSAVTASPYGEPGRPLNIFYDVDHTLVFIDQSGHTLRPGAHESMRRLKAAGHGVFVWSAGGKEYVERTVEKHGLQEWVDGCFDKDPKVQPKPDFIIDDDWFLVEKYGGHLVSQYKVVDQDDRELLEALERLAELGHL